MSAKTFTHVDPALLPPRHRGDLLDGAILSVSNWIHRVVIARSLCGESSDRLVLRKLGSRRYSPWAYQYKFGCALRTIWASFRIGDCGDWSVALVVSKAKRNLARLMEMENWKASNLMMARLSSLTVDFDHSCEDVFSEANKGKLFRRKKRLQDKRTGVPVQKKPKPGAVPLWRSAVVERSAC